MCNDQYICTYHNKCYHQYKCTLCMCVYQYNSQWMFIEQCVNTDRYQYSNVLTSACVLTGAIECVLTSACELMCAYKYL